ncbi:DUF3768 domain-containing protein [Bosea eneae]|uniref:DUF3768 domain-containing protein n=1 Tax=Bosea eneae TaxID=151454 RepID=A0ABW0J1N3_9HYPH
MNNTERYQHAQIIRELNDLFRQSFIGGAVVVTASIAALGAVAQCAIVAKVRAFDAFDPDNDPFQEHDFGAIEHEGVTVFFKIDYFDRSMSLASEDPADPKLTTRVLTIMLASDY